MGAMLPSTSTMEPFLCRKDFRLKRMLSDPSRARQSVQLSLGLSEPSGRMGCRVSCRFLPISSFSA